MEGHGSPLEVEVVSRMLFSSGESWEPPLIVAFSMREEVTPSPVSGEGWGEGKLNCPVIRKLLFANAIEVQYPGAV